MTVAVMTNSGFDVSCHYVHIVYNELLLYNSIQSLHHSNAGEISYIDRTFIWLTFSGVATGKGHMGASATAPSSVQD